MQAYNNQVLPQIDVDKEKLKQSVDNSYIANRVKASATDETNPLLMGATSAAIWYGISQGMDVFNKSCAKEYDKTIFGKLGKFGDDVAGKWNNTSIGKFFNNLLGKGKDVGNWMSEKNNIAYSLKNHSGRAEWGFAKTPGAGLHGFLAMDMTQVFDEYLQPISKNANRASWLRGKDVSVQRLQQYGMKQSDIDAFKKSLKNKTFKEKQLLIQKKELELLGVKPDRLARCNNLTAMERLANRIKVRRVGFDSIADYNRIKSDILSHPKEVVAALEKATKNGDITVPIWRKTKLSAHLLGREVSLMEYLNKYKATLGLGNKTALGRFLPKAMGWLLEGCTNRFAGGKIAVAMQAGIFADMLIQTFKAPSGEKGKTLAERFVNDFTYFMALPLGIFAMHKVGGLKYAGMTTAQVEAYRNALQQFNSDVKNGLLSDKKVYKARVKELKKMLAADVKNPITKLFKKLGSLIEIGNETRLARRSKAKWNLNLLRKSGNFFRNLAGVPLRIAIPLMIVSPFLAKLTTKGAHAIFGKPTKSVLDEDKEDQTNKNESLEQKVEEPKKESSAPTAFKPQEQTYPQASTNLLNQYVTKKSTIKQTPLAQNTKQEQNTLSTVQAPKRYIPSPECTIKPEPEKKKYIPSPESVVSAGANDDYSAVESALKKADNIEQMVNETLSMR